MIITLHIAIVVVIAVGVMCVCAVSCLRSRRDRGGTRRRYVVACVVLQCVGCWVCCNVRGCAVVQQMVYVGVMCIVGCGAGGGCVYSVA